jgi:hypothetical protein
MALTKLHTFFEDRLPCIFPGSYVEAVLRLSHAVQHVKLNGSPCNSGNFSDSEVKQALYTKRGRRSDAAHDCIQCASKILETKKNGNVEAH